MKSFSEWLFNRQPLQEMANTFKKGVWRVSPGKGIPSVSIGTPDTDGIVHALAKHPEGLDVVGLIRAMDGGPFYDSLDKKAQYNVKKNLRAHIAQNKDKAGIRGDSRVGDDQLFFLGKGRSTTDTFDSRGVSDKATPGVDPAFYTKNFLHNLLVYWNRFGVNGSIGFRDVGDLADAVVSELEKARPPIINIIRQLQVSKTGEDFAWALAHILAMRLEPEVYSEADIGKFLSFLAQHKGFGVEAQEALKKIVREKPYLIGPMLGELADSGKFHEVFPILSQEIIDTVKNAGDRGPFIAIQMFRSFPAKLSSYEDMFKKAFGMTEEA